MRRLSRIPITVRWADIDPVGHVNNAVFLTYLEEGRDSFMRERLGSTYLDLVLVRIELDYRAEIPLGTPEVVVTCALESLGNASIRTREQVLMPDGSVAAESLTTCVVRDAATRRSRPWTAAERAAIGSPEA